MYAVKPDDPMAREKEIPFSLPLLQPGAEVDMHFTEKKPSSSFQLHFSFKRTGSLYQGCCF